jgi:ATP-dependent protease HslVU (ClpYQ) ATPase subunit
LQILTPLPLLQVEATKYTEIGFHGKDVDSIIRDLVEHAITLTKTKRRQKLKKKIDRNVERKILDALVGKGDPRTRKDFRVHYRKGLLEDQTVCSLMLSYALLFDRHFRVRRRSPQKSRRFAMHGITITSQ